MKIEIPTMVFKKKLNFTGEQIKSLFDENEIYTYETESPFWKYAVPTFLVLALIYFISRAF